MPKIIPDLSNRILEAASHHFEAKGYEATDMKSLAVELGISVGALYNYHPSKPELFVAVAARWKADLTSRLLENLASPYPADQRLRSTLMMLYENMEAFTGIWREFLSTGERFAHDSPQNQGFRRDNKELNQRLQALFQEVWAQRPEALSLVKDPQDRLAQIVTGSIMQLVMNGHDDHPGTRAFVELWVDFLAPALPQ
jgi:AcrR family transcriptional regulator